MTEPSSTRSVLDRELSAELVRSSGAVQRAVRRAARPFEGPRLAPSQVGLARLVRTRPGLSVREAALLLGLAPNTVSTLVTALVDGGWIERRTDVGDKRVARLHLTADGSARMAAWRGRRDDAATRAVHQVVQELGTERVLDAVQVLQAVVDQLGPDAVATGQQDPTPERLEG